MKKIILAESVIYTAGMTGLAVIWYGKDTNQSFTFFNDNAQWLQMDKAGHIYTAYHLSLANSKLLQSTGIPQKKALFWSGISSTAMMLPIEIMDGYSSNYGASWGDFVANAIGAFLPFQQLLWAENYLHPKYSFSPTHYANIRPYVLGSNYYEQWLKDYNGQTYWLSANFNLLSKENIFPEWMAFSVGYSGREMLYGNPEENIANGYQAQRQLFLSLDVDFSKIETQQKWLRHVFYLVNLIKIPFPTLEWRGNQLILHPVYF
ncbi:DUF2279 domain-containing protein [Marivirga sp. S37H4]|uniref:DUF2279 domain-containing protein n=1 Tax=Marivirga aurantiaca TaxID=2802615 RepID=A0A935CAQ5_9BACT|nr:DUF2279 domain-containing protein [Marivirga aurantiaca]MBK6266337.1 DUF2279 domain-containing protein [Marivirga aurantiaca]